MTLRVAVFTGTRAEYGLLYWLMKAIQASPDLDLQLIVSGTHLTPGFGETRREIEADGFAIDAKVEMLLSSDTPTGVVKSLGLGTIGFADALDRLKPDWLVVLGDRFETLAVVQAALIMQIPVAHLHGGEVTEGAYDDAIRHAITKMAHLHFVAAEPYRQRVIQMGEAPDAVYNVGAVGLDHLLKAEIMGFENVRAGVSGDLRPGYFLVTYHPVTLADEDPVTSVRAIFAALDGFPDHQLIVTYPNADNGGQAIIAELEEVATHDASRIFVVPTLGQARYLGALKHAAAVVGNSSSGIIEAPSFGVPTVNIGARQRGRLRAPSIIQCEADPDAIRRAVTQALDPDFVAASRRAVNPYGRGDAAAQIVRVLETRKGSIVKRFHDMDCR